METGARETQARARALFGDAAEALGAPAGVAHVTAVWRPPDAAAPLVTLRLCDETPASATDGFVLGLARARADAIVTTGKNLRDEPALTHDVGPALAAWRRERLGKREPALSVVLTAGRGLDLSHPFFRAGTRPVLVTSREAAVGLRRDGERAARDLGVEVEVVARAAPDLRDTLGWLARERGCDTVSMETGPSTSRALYDEPLAVDELWLSLFAEPRLPEGVRGGALLPEARLAALLGPPRSEVARREASGSWLFRRYRRRD